MNDMDEWWAKLLRDRYADGRLDAGAGIYDPPYPGSEDPQDQSEQNSYDEGWNARRKELGKKFKWAQ